MSKIIRKSSEFNENNFVVSGEKDLNIDSKKGKLVFHHIYYKYNFPDGKQNYLNIKCPKITLKYGFFTPREKTEDMREFSCSFYYEENEENEEIKDFFLLMKKIELSIANIISSKKNTLSKYKILQGFESSNYKNNEKFKSLFWFDEKNNKERIYFHCRPYIKNEHQRTKFFIPKRDGKGFIEVSWNKIKDKALEIIPNIRISWSSIPQHKTAISHKIFVTDVLITKVFEKESRTSFDEKDLEGTSSEDIVSIYKNIDEATEEENFDDFINKTDEEFEEDKED